MPTVTRSDAMDEVLSIVDGIGFEMGPGGFTSHAPMGAETIVTLGYADQAVPWIDRYLREVPHTAPPESTGSRLDPNDEVSWRSALGMHERLMDWILMFEEEMENEPWPAVLARWWPGLLPGFLGGLTHGLIRTAHAVRTLTAAPEATPQRRRELARGLAYMAARYAWIPGDPQPAGALSPGEAIAGLPEIHPREAIGAGVRSRTGDRRVEGGEIAPGFAEAVDALAPPAEYARTLLDITRETGKRLRSRAASYPSDIQMIASVHCFTAPAAARMLLPHLPPETQPETFARVWQVTALLAGAFGTRGAPPVEDDPGRQPLSPDELKARALESRAAHAIKLTEACIREYQDTLDPGYLFVAEDVVPHIRATDSTPGG